MNRLTCIKSLSGAVVYFDRNPVIKIKWKRLTIMIALSFIVSITGLLWSSMQIKKENSDIYPATILSQYKYGDIMSINNTLSATCGEKQCCILLVNDVKCYSPLCRAIVIADRIYYDAQSRPICRQTSIDEYDKFSAIMTAIFGVFVGLSIFLMTAFTIPDEYYHLVNYQTRYTEIEIQRKVNELKALEANYCGLYIIEAC